MLGPLVVLSMGSLFSGIILSDTILGFTIHPVISILIKMMPLILSLIGGFIGILLYILTKRFWSLFIGAKLIYIYQFLSSA